MRRIYNFLRNSYFRVRIYSLKSRRLDLILSKQASETGEGFQIGIPPREEIYHQIEKTNKKIPVWKKSFLNNHENKRRQHPCFASCRRLKHRT